MPTYDYKCNSCQHRFEILQSMNDEVLKLCPKCKKNDLERLIGAGSGLIFKGSGFYITDYVKKKNNSDTNKSENKPKNKRQDDFEVGMADAKFIKFLSEKTQKDLTKIKETAEKKEPTEGLMSRPTQEEDE